MINYTIFTKDCEQFFHNLSRPSGSLTLVATRGDSANFELTAQNEQTK
jgi:hypothetical protein